MTPPLLAPGSLLGGRWIMGRQLGQSEDALVYEAEAANERRFAAIKFFHSVFAAEPAWSEHAALTRALSALPGEALARAYDIGLEPSSGRPYVASERVTFPTLARYVAERGPLSLRALSQLLETLAGALDVAHAAGIVHGGLKPQNVFVSFDNASFARITDFSVWRLRAATGYGSAAVLGWSAPEAAAGVMLPASDRYALALLCFFAATGLPWYNALRPVERPQTDKQRTRVASERAKSQGGELDASFDAWFKQALAADPHARFRDAASMARAFLDVFTAGPTFELVARVPENAPENPPETAPESRAPETLAPETNAPDTPMASTLAVPEAKSPDPLGPRPASAHPNRRSESPAPLPKASLQALTQVLWALVAGSLLVLALVAWWLRTR